MGVANILARRHRRNKSARFDTIRTGTTIVATNGPANSLLTRASIFDRLRDTDQHARELAWGAFCHRYTPIISSFARRLGAREDRCDDLVQDVLTGFFSASEKFQYDPATGRFRGYLKACVRSALIKRLGQDAKFDGVPLQDVEAEHAGFDQVWDDVWETEHLRVAIEQVEREFKGHPKTVRAFKEYVLNERDAADVAAELRISLNSVHQAKKRISDLLRVRLSELERGLR
jgi:RNA polymerase sigma-70 factor, ECF subfamily